MSCVSAYQVIDCFFLKQGDSNFGLLIRRFRFDRILRKKARYSSVCGEPLFQKAYGSNQQSRKRMGKENCLWIALWNGAMGFERGFEFKFSWRSCWFPTKVPQFSNRLIGMDNKKLISFFRKRSVSWGNSVHLQHEKKGGDRRKKPYHQQTIPTCAGYHQRRSRQERRCRETSCKQLGSGFCSWYHQDGNAESRSSDLFSPSQV